MDDELLDLVSRALSNPKKQRVSPLEPNFDFPLLQYQSMQQPNPPPGNSQQPQYWEPEYNRQLNVKDALSYLEQVKAQCRWCV